MHAVAGALRTATKRGGARALPRHWCGGMPVRASGPPPRWEAKEQARLHMCCMTCILTARPASQWGREVPVSMCACTTQPAEAHVPEAHRDVQSRSRCLAAGLRTCGEMARSWRHRTRARSRGHVFAGGLVHMRET